jgi:hypothetical protein
MVSYYIAVGCGFRSNKLGAVTVSPGGRSNLQTAHHVDFLKSPFRCIFFPISLFVKIG